jgi:plasmid stabilization system protein ParE
MTIRSLPEAEADIETAAEWYEQQRAGLGDDFLAAVRDGFDTIERSPQAFTRATPPLPGREVRRLVLSRFSYSIFYEVRPGEIVVLAVVHQRRRPGIWQTRQP